MVTSEGGGSIQRAQRTRDKDAAPRYRTAPGSVRAFCVGPMSDPIDETEMRRRRLRYRAWHRGTREMDLILGRFADAELAGLSVIEIEQLEGLMDVPDPDLFDWIVGNAPVPPRHDTMVFRRLIEFHRGEAGRSAS
jgi:antitoxin CptB